MSEPAIHVEELHAFIDGELSESRRIEIEAALERDPSLAAQVAAFRSDKELIGRIYAPLGNAPVPRAWVETIERRTAPRPRRRWVPVSAAIAASIALFIIASNVHRSSSEGSVV